jgi:RNA polymerase sigma factor (sigma-70 family)
MTPVDQSIEAAYTAHAAGLSRRLAVMTRDPAAAEDLTHEAFVRLATEMHAGRAPDNVPAWLHRVGSNLVASRGRHASVADRHLASLPRPDVAPSPEAASISAEEARLVRSALGTLARSDRHALVLAAQGYAGPEIALRIGRTEGATRTLLCRARTKMRVQLQAAGIDR